MIFAAVKGENVIKCCVFDLDGTLLSTLDTITLHLNNTLRREGLLEITIDECRTYIGDGARKLVTRAVGKSGDVDGERFEKILSTYNEAYNSDPLPLTEPYPGVIALVSELVSRGYRLAVVTNKPEPTARKLVDHFFKDKFSLVIGGRSGAVLKPDPTDTLNAIAELGCLSSEAAFIGDTSVDILTAKNADVALSVGVSWGFREITELLTAGADVIIDEARNLICELENR